MQARRFNRPCYDPVYVEGQKTQLSDLPNEILQKICKDVVDGPHLIDLTLQVKWRGGKKFRDDAQYPYEVDRIVKIAKNIKQLEHVLYDCLRQDARFTSSSTCIARLPAVFGEHSCTLIKSLQVNVSKATREHPDDVLPQMLTILSTKMPNLTVFEMACYTFDSVPDAEFEKRMYQPLLRCMAFLVHQSSHLKRIILPRDSGVVGGMEHGYSDTKFYLITESCERRNWKSRTDCSNSKDYEVKRREVSRNEQSALFQAKEFDRTRS